MEQKSILNTKISPYTQAIGVVVILLLFDMVSYSGKAGETPLQYAKDIWTNSIALVLFYIIANCLLSVATDTNAKYIRDSIFAYLGLVVCSALIAQGLGGMSMDEAGSFRWLFVVLSMGYVIFLAIISTMKFLVTLAKRQDTRLRGE